MIQGNICMGISTTSSFAFCGAGVGVHSTTKKYFEKYENISLNIYMIFYFETVGKAYKNKIQNALYKVFSLGTSCSWWQLWNDEKWAMTIYSNCTDMPVNVLFLTSK